MKRNYIIVILCICCSLAACIKDKTNLQLREINPIVIDTTGVAPSFVLFQMDTLKVKPTVTKDGLPPEKLVYEWSMNAFQGYKRILGTSMQLHAPVTEAPSSTNYTLMLTVTDTSTNLKGFFTWSVSVNPRFGEGLVVADTRDGVHGDISLIMAFNFTGNFPDESDQKIYRGLYSQANGAELSEKAHTVSFMNYQNARSLMLLTDNAIVRLNPISYKVSELNEKLFILPPDGIRPQAAQSIQLINQHEYIINNGKVHSRFGGSWQFYYPFLIDNTGYECSKVCGLQQPSGAGGVIYDEKNSRFLMLPTMTSSSAPLTKFPAVDNSTPAPAFDPGDMGNKTCLHMEEGYNKRVMAIMKDREADNLYACQLTVVNPVNGKMGYAMHSLNNNPDIQAAKYFTCSTGEQVLFYATDKKVYSSTLLVSGATSPNLRYTAAPGEVITGMRMHIRGGKMYLPSLTDPNDYSLKRTMNSANRLLVLSTWNESTKEGKIIAIPLETLGVGGLVTNPEYIRTYGGFGKITAFNFQGS